MCIRDSYRIRDQHMDILELIEKRKALQAADMGASSKRETVKAEAKDKSDYNERRDRDKERRRLLNQVERSEARMAELEKEEKELQVLVMKNGLPAAEVQKGYDRMGEIAKLIAEQMQQWEAAGARLQELGDEIA